MMRSVALRLTLIYLAIIMALSISFSVVIYRLSYRQMMHSLPGQKVFIQFVDPDRFPDFNAIRQQTLEDSEHSLQMNLILLNLGTLVVGAALSYVLARRTLEPIEEAFEMQGRFTADASHELRTPLTAMQTSIEVGLRNPKLSLDDAKGLLNGTLDEVRKLGSLSNGLLKLTRSNGQDMPKKPVSLKTISNEAVSQLELAANNKQIKIINNAEPIKALGDDISIKEVIVILLDNAIKYSGPNSSITLNTRQHGKVAILSVSDQGQGMKSTDVMHVFDRFYRADQSRSRDHIEGYGLGLPIAKQIVDAHGGTIDVKSKPGEGSTFTVKLPLAQPASS